ncbi:ThuA domain-containing protein [Microbacterium sp. STN6]|uniref:ThuA domain-containing protein n=1 Tax=Microbacterium sp. STN6 TaxID=2995588 RepID=UPI002260C70B|nr:ThuA domain-containing protein [Microbacterium sp. STN6]MCX7520829.1 ThuA domain-containing protein [Microbacterium sp. STN6]
MNGATRRALVVRGGWDGHQPVETTESVIPFLEANGFEVRVEESSGIYADADYMAGVDLIVQTNTMNTIADNELAGLIAAVKNGTGMGGWHGGIADSYRNSADYLQMIGGQFAHHAAKAPKSELAGGQEDNYLTYTINIVPERAEHPIVAGLSDFTLTTEQYWVLSDDYNDVLATTTVEARAFDPWHRPVTTPAVWTREWGAGRIFVCTAGHRLEVLDDPNVRMIVERGLLWAAR